MRVKQYQVDAFATRVFEGNPAAVCPLDHWLDDSLRKEIANENNLSGNRFFVPSENGFQLFDGLHLFHEVDLCGHATLAAAHVLFDILGYSGKQITFQTKSGELVVESKDGLLAMDFPARPPVVKPIPDALSVGLGRPPLEVWAANDYIAVFEDEETLRSISPDFAKLQELDLRGVIVTAPGTDVDFVSRFFAPQIGIPEDPVTGAAHSELTPYWAQRLGKTSFEARQVSPRGGKLSCQLRGNRVILSGKAVTFMIGEIDLGV